MFQNPFHNSSRKRAADTFASVFRLPPRHMHPTARTIPEPKIHPVRPSRRATVRRRSIAPSRHLRQTRYVPAIIYFRLPIAADSLPDNDSPRSRTGPKQPKTRPPDTHFRIRIGELRIFDDGPSPYTAFPSPIASPAPKSARAASATCSVFPVGYPVPSFLRDELRATAKFPIFEGEPSRYRGRTVNP